MFGDTQPGKTISALRGDGGRATQGTAGGSAGGGAPLLAGSLGIETVDKYTVRFVNGTPDVTMEGRFALWHRDHVWSRASTRRRPMRLGEQAGHDRPLQDRRVRPDVSLLLEAHDEYWGGRPPLSASVLSRCRRRPASTGLLSGEYQFACDLPPDQISHRADPAFEVQGGTILNHRLTVFDKNHAQLRDPLVRRAMTHSIDRQAIVEAFGPAVRACRGAAMGLLRRDVHRRLGGAGLRSELARELVKQAGYKGDPIPYRLLNNYYTNQTATAQVLVEMWKAAGLNVEIQMKENWAADSRAHADPGGTRLVEFARPSTIPSPRSSPSTARTASSSSPATGRNDEMNPLSANSGNLDRPRRAARRFRRMLEIASARTPPIRCCTRTRPSRPSPRPSNGRPRRPSPWISAPEIGDLIRSAGGLLDGSWADSRLRRHGGAGWHRPHVEARRSVGLVGRSAPAETVTWLAALVFLPKAASVDGTVKLDGKEVLGARPLPRMDRVAATGSR